jgi:transposase-like protein
MSRKQEVAAEKKVEVIRQYKKGEISLREAARTAGVSVGTIQRWQLRYETEGASGFIARERNRKYSQETKMNAVRDYLSGAGSYIEICKVYKISTPTIFAQWVKVYNVHGDFNFSKQSGGGSYMKQGRDTTQEERIQIAKDCIATGKNYGEMALKHKVSYQQARTWTLRYEELGEAGLEDRRGKRKKDQTPRTELEKAQIEIEQLKHKLYLSEMENALLKKLDEIERSDASGK